MPHAPGTECFETHEVNIASKRYDTIEGLLLSLGDLQPFSHNGNGPTTGGSKTKQLTCSTGTWFRTQGEPDRKYAAFMVAFACLVGVSFEESLLLFS